MSSIMPSRLLHLTAGVVLALWSVDGWAASQKSTAIAGTLQGKCKVEFLCPGAATCTSLKFTAKAQNSKETPNDTTGDVRWSCNLSGQSATLTFTSANGGILKSTNASFPYTISYTGSNSTTLSRVDLKQPRYVTGTSVTALTIYNGVLTLRPEPNGPFYAGNYTDTISVTINPSGL